jgi:hypothetical protein
MAAGKGPVGKAGFAPGEAIVRQMFSGLKLGAYSGGDFQPGSHNRIWPGPHSKA